MISGHGPGSESEMEKPAFPDTPNLIYPYGVVSVVYMIIYWKGEDLSGGGSKPFSTSLPVRSVSGRALTNLAISSVKLSQSKKIITFKRNKRDNGIWKYLS